MNKPKNKRPKINPLVFTQILLGNFTASFRGNQDIWWTPRTMQLSIEDSKDLTLRLNNWYKVKSSILTNAILSGVAFGIVITVLLLGLIQVFGQKRKSYKLDCWADNR